MPGLKHSPAPIRTVTSFYDLPSELALQLGHIALTAGYAHDESLIEHDPRTGEWTLIKAVWGEVKSRRVLATDNPEQPGRFRLPSNS